MGAVLLLFLLFLPTLLENVGSLQTRCCKLCWHINPFAVPLLYITRHRDNIVRFNMKLPPPTELQVNSLFHYNDVIMSVLASPINSLTIVYSTVYSCADHWKHQSSASLVFVRGIQRWPVNSPHKGTVTRKMFPFDDVIISVDWLIDHVHFRHGWPCADIQNIQPIHISTAILCSLSDNYPISTAQK